MTATRDPRADTSEPTASTRWDERPIAGPWRGLPWWAVVLIGFGLAAVGAVIDIETGGEIGALFKTCYVVGAVAAIAVVRRRNLFGPMVQPPLIIGIIVPGVVLASSGLPEDNDTMSTALTVGRPLIRAFPIMAITTGVVLLIGLFRLYRERDPQRRNRGDPAGNQLSGGKQSGKSTTDPARAERPRGERAPDESGGSGPGSRARRGAEGAAAGRESQPPARQQPSTRQQPPARQQPSARQQSSAERQAPGQRKPRAERDNASEQRSRTQGQKPPPPADRERQRRSQGAGGEQRDRRQQGQQQRSGKQPPPEAARSGKPQQSRRSPPPEESGQPRRSGQSGRSEQPGRSDRSGKQQRPERRGEQEQRGQQRRPDRQGNSEQQRRQPPPQQRPRREDDQPPRRKPPERPWE